MTHSNNEMQNESEVEKPYRYFELKRTRADKERSRPVVVRVDKDWDVELENFSESEKERILEQSLKTLGLHTNHAGMHLARVYQSNDNYTIWFSSEMQMNAVNNKEILSASAYNKKLRACTQLQTNEVTVQNFVHWEPEHIRGVTEYCQTPFALSITEAALVKRHPPADDVLIKETQHSVKLLTTFDYKPEFDLERWRLEAFIKDIRPLNRYLDQNRGMELLNVQNLNQDLQAYLKNYYSTKAILFDEMDDMYEKLEPSEDISPLAEKAIEPFKLELKDKLANLQDKIKDEHNVIVNRIESYKNDMAERAISFAQRDENYQAQLDKIIQQFYEKLVDAINQAIKQFANENLAKIRTSKHPQSDMDAIIKKYGHIFILNTDPNHDYQIDLKNKGTLIKLVNFINELSDKDPLRKIVFEQIAPVVSGSTGVLKIDKGNVSYSPTQTLMEKMISDLHDSEITARNEVLMAQTKLSSEVKAKRMNLKEGVDQLHHLETQLSNMFKDINSFNTTVQLDIERILTRVIEARANYMSHTGGDTIEALFVEMKADIAAINLLRVAEITKKEKALYEAIKATPKIKQALEEVQQFEKELASTKQTIQTIQEKLHGSVVTFQERLSNDLQKRQEEFYEQLRSLVMDNLHFWQKRVKYGIIGKYITATNNETFKVPEVIAEMHDYFKVHNSKSSAGKNLKNLIADISLKDFGTTDKAKEFIALLKELKNLKAGDFNNLQKLEPIIRKFSDYKATYGTEFIEARVAAKSRLRFSGRVSEDEPVSKDQYSNNRSSFPRQSK